MPGGIGRNETSVHCKNCSGGNARSVKPRDDASDNGLQIPETDIKMSSLSRRACYKCGNVGHYAEVCSSSERLCYNCKQPGESDVEIAV